MIKVSATRTKKSLKREEVADLHEVVDSMRNVFLGHMHHLPVREVIVVILCQQERALDPAEGPAQKRRTRRTLSKLVDSRLLVLTVQLLERCHLDHLSVRNGLDLCARDTSQERTAARDNQLSNQGCTIHAHSEPGEGSTAWKSPPFL